MKNKIGTGIRATAKKPRRVVAQGTPRLWNMAAANIGNPAPAPDLKRVFAATALFACHL